MLLIYIPHFDEYFISISIPTILIRIHQDIIVSLKHHIYKQNLHICENMNKYDILILFF
jgi:hypothetical protein